MAQAETEARAAQQAAYTQPTATAVAYPSGDQPEASYTAPPQQLYAQSPQQDAARSAEALDGGGEVAELEYFKKQLNVTQQMCQQAIGMYQQSMQLNKKAQRDNLMGAVIDRPGRRKLLYLILLRRKF